MGGRGKEHLSRRHSVKQTSYYPLATIKYTESAKTRVTRTRKLVAQDNNIAGQKPCTFQTPIPGTSAERQKGKITLPLASHSRQPPQSLSIRDSHHSQSFTSQSRHIFCFPKASEDILQPHTRTTKPSSLDNDRLAAK